MPNETSSLFPTLFPATQDGTAARRTNATGILPYQTIRALVNQHEISSLHPVEKEQIQPASIDLRLGKKAYRMQSSFLPGENYTVAEKIQKLKMHEFSIEDGAVLEKGCVYIIPLLETLKLSASISGVANPKSSTGRLDIFTRLITDRATEFDTVKERYEGPLYVEVSPKTFSVIVRTGTRLNQLRLSRGSHMAAENEVRRLHNEVRLVDRQAGDLRLRQGSVLLTVDLEGSENGLIGYKAKKHAPILNLDLINHYSINDYWEPIHLHNEGLILNPDDFYILASKEAVTVPKNYAAEMVAYDTLVGEFRVHYAGFFDPGFGLDVAGGSGSKAVLEVRSHEVPFLIEDGQVVGLLAYQRLTSIPDVLYGLMPGSNYQAQGLKLSKHFRTL